MISVVIPVFNSESTLERCLDSLCAQTYEDFECVVINDGSTDHSLDILNRYKAENKIGNMKIITTENRGQGHARNVGIRMSLGEFVSFVDSDDVVKSQYLEHMIAAMGKETTMVVGSIDRKFEYKPSILERSFRYSSDLELVDNETVENHPSLLLEVINAPYAKLIRKDFLLDNNISFAENIIYEDMVFTHRILGSGAKIRSIPEKDYEYMVRKGTTMTANKNIEDIFLAMDQVLEGYSNTKNIKEYLDYFVFHHVCIGGMYRTFLLNKKRMLFFLKESRCYLKVNGCDIKANFLMTRENIVIKGISLLYR